MSWLYACTIYPLQLFYKYVYLACIHLTGSYGLGLIGLSLVCAVAFVPLGRIAKKMKWNEDDLQDVLRPQIEKIKAQYTGAERQDAIARLYKRYSYHPLMTLRSAIGIFLQLPFLMAAYHMIKELTVLQGQSFWLIKDLSMPDGLLGGINALPILMTLINFATIATTPNMRGKNRIQAVVIALLFLWLLYGAPSALLIYWTCNNINYLAQNFVFRDKKRTEKSAWQAFHFSFSSFGSEVAFGTTGREIVNAAFFVLLFTASAFFAFEVREVIEAVIAKKPNIVAAMKGVYLCVLVLCVAFTLFSVRTLLRQKFTTAEIFFKTALAAVGFAGLGFFVRFLLSSGGTIDLNGAPFSLLLWAVVLYCALTVLFGIPYRSVKSALARLFDGHERGVYFGSVSVVVVLLFFFCEAELYASDPAFFNEPLWKMLLQLTPYAVGVFTATVALWFAVPRGGKYLLATFALLMMTLAFLNVFVFTGNYGALDVTILSNTETLYDKANYFKDLGIVLICGSFIWAILKLRLCKFVGKILMVIVFSLVFFCSYSIFNTLSSKKSLPANIQNLLPDYHDRLWGFSKDGKNVIIFFWDMFTGGHMQEILAKNPNLKNELSGFVWYPDTISVGSNTFLTAPSLLGGGRFTPIEWNKEDKKTNVEKMYAAYSVLPNAFLKAGYDVAVAGMPYADMSQLKSCLVNDKALLLDYGHWEKQYENYWYKMLARQQNNVTNQLSSYVFSVALFKALPYSVRAGIYDNGNWNGLASRVASITATKTIKDLAPVQFMSTFSNTNVQNDVFKIIYSHLSHYDWHLPENSVIPVSDPYPHTKGQLTIVDGIIPEHFYTEQHMMRFLGQFCSWLKREHIYDNTRIIVVSDHDERDSNMLNSALGGDWSGIIAWEEVRKYPGRPHALMLFKDFSSSGEFLIDPRLVSTEDTVALASMGLVKIDTVPSQEELKGIQKDSIRVRNHCISSWRPESHKTNTLIFSLARVSGTIFKSSNWQLLGKQGKNEREERTVK